MGSVSLTVHRTCAPKAVKLCGPDSFNPVRIGPSCSLAFNPSPPSVHAPCRPFQRNGLSFLRASSDNLNGQVVSLRGQESSRRKRPLWARLGDSSHLRAHLTFRIYGRGIKQSRQTTEDREARGGDSFDVAQKL